MRDAAVRVCENPVLLGQSRSFLLTPTGSSFIQTTIVANLGFRALQARCFEQPARWSVLKHGPW